jgi:flagellar secretion chaperone FliS
MDGKMMNPYQRYLDATAETATPLELVLMLYQGVLRSTGQAIQAVEQRDVAEAHKSLIRAQDIVFELSASLNRAEGGATADNLAALYDYSYRRLVDANVRKDAAPAEEVARLFRDLLPAWQEVADTQRQETAASHQRLAVAV